jgi:hypothetical protein
LWSTLRRAAPAAGSGAHTRRRRLALALAVGVRSAAVSTTHDLENANDSLRRLLPVPIPGGEVSLANTSPALWVDEGGLVLALRTIVRDDDGLRVAASHRCSRCTLGCSRRCNHSAATSPQIRNAIIGGSECGAEGVASGEGIVLTVARRRRRGERHFFAPW